MKTERKPEDVAFDRLHALVREASTKMAAVSILIQEAIDGGEKENAMFALSELGTELGNLARPLWKASGDLGEVMP